VRFTNEKAETARPTQELVRVFRKEGDKFPAGN